MVYPDKHPLSNAFLANRLDRLADLIATQGEEMLRDAGLNMPSRTVSLILLIGERGHVSAADAASILGQPHQLVTQRVDVLLDGALIARTDDPADGRRKILALTARGRDQHARLSALLSATSEVFGALFEEIGCDLSSMAARAMEALDRTSLRDRVNRQKSKITATPSNQK
jgi:DNA-binding MarR family transcriptional regulator